MCSGYRCQVAAIRPAGEEDLCRVGNAFTFPLGLFGKDPRIFVPLIGVAVLYACLQRNDVWEKLV